MIILNMKESYKHLDLKRYIELKYRNKGFDTIREGIFNGLLIDVIVIKNKKIVKLVECIVSQRINEVLDRLIPFKNIDREIVRYWKPKNPKAKKIIKKIIDNGILFTEVKISDRI